MCLSKTVSSSVFAITRRGKSAKVLYLYYRNFLKFVGMITYLQMEEEEQQILEVINFKINIIFCKGIEISKLVKRYFFFFFFKTKNIHHSKART